MKIAPFFCMYNNSGYLYVSNYLFVLNVWTIHYRGVDSIYSLSKI